MGKQATFEGWLDVDFEDTSLHDDRESMSKGRHGESAKPLVFSASGDALLKPFHGKKIRMVVEVLEE